MKYYKRLTTRVDDANYNLYPDNTDFWSEELVNTESDYYLSIFDYTEEQYNKFLETKTIARITDVSTHEIVFDFDATKENFDPAREDTFRLINRLTEDLKIDSKNISVAFSGSRGFSVKIISSVRLSLDEVKILSTQLLKDLKTADYSIYTNSGIFRIIGTKNNKSGLYKTSLTMEELDSFTDEEIKKKASSIDTIEDIKIESVLIPSKLYRLERIKEKEVKILNDFEINFTQKPKGWSNCKWALAQGYDVKSGDRKVKLVALVATCRALNFTKEQAYYMAKNSYEKGMERYGGEAFEKSELWDDVVERVYSPSWNGGMYSCKDSKTPWLTNLCNSLGRHKCNTSDLDVVSVDKVFDLFNDYAENFEKNVLKTGIDNLDENCKLMVGTSNGILAPPGVGKTSLSLGVLNYNSNQDNQCVFFSFDMFHSLVYLRLIQKHFGYKQDKAFDIFKHNKKEASRIREKIEQEYKNVHFCFKSGQTADQIHETILDVEDKTGKKVKLGMVDYNELVISGISDPTQSSAQVAQRLRQIANDASVCMVTLLQPSKVFSNPSDEISTYQGAKGSGAIAQSLSLMLSLSRPGFHPRHPEDDKFITINALKYRQGPLFTIDLHWDGLSGQVRQLSDEEYHHLEQVRQKRDAEKGESTGGFG